MLAPGPAGFKGRFVREIMLLLSVCDKAFKSLQVPSQHKISQHSGHVSACKGCGKNFNPNNSINRHNKLVSDKPQHTQSFFPLLYVEQGPPLRRSSSIWMCGVRRRGRGWFWLAPGSGQTSSTLTNGNISCWLKNKCVMFFSSFYFLILFLLCRSGFVTQTNHNCC